MTIIFDNLAALHTAGSITVTELDGSPVVSNVSTLKLTNGALTDNTDGSVSISVGTGSGNGDMLGPVASIDGEVALFSGTNGKVLKRSTLSGILKIASGVQQVATPGTDFAPATSGTAILKGNGAGAFANASAGTDYLAPPSGTSILKGNSGGALSNASAGSDYLAPAGSGAALTGMTKSQVGLSNVDNTTDLGKPVSTAQQTALDLKASIASPTFTGTIGGITKTMVGLSNVDNTTDLNKPISTATQTALDLKAPIASPTFTGTVSGVSASMVNLGNVNNTSDANKPISTATQTALDLKATLVSPSFTGNLNILLQANDNVFIDARTYPRTSLTTGALRLNHTAGKTGTRPISLDIDAAGFADTHAISVNYIATGLGIGTENHGFDFSVDTDNSTGGNIAALSVTKTGTGAIGVSAVEVYPGVDVIEQEVGVNITADSNFTYSGGAYTSATAAFGSSGTNIQLFVANTDYVYIGHSLKFGIIDIALSIFATGLGVIPTFEYSVTGGGGWTTFSPGDTTNGFRQNGTIAIPTLPLWTATTVNGVTGKYWIRIRRTNAAAITVPTENTIQVIVSAICGWNKLGAVHISNLNVSSLGVYSNNAAAISGGLVIGDIYRTSGGTLNVVV